MKKILSVLMVLSVLLLVGCVDYEETMILNADGSGRVLLKVGMDTSMMDSMGLDMFEDEEEEDEEEFQGLNIGDDFRDMEGVTLVSEREWKEEGWTWSEVVIAFDSLEKMLAAIEQDLQDDDTYEDSGSPFGEITWERTRDGHWEFHRSIPLFGDEGEEMDEMGLTMLRAFFGDTYFYYHVQFPGRILEANTETDLINHQTNTVTWKFSMPDMMSANQVMWAKVQR